MGRILLVEDEKVTQTLITKCLQNRGHEVIAAADGREALSRLDDPKPDLIITDVLMPNMDGFQFFKQLKKDEATKNIPVLILSAREKMEDTFMAFGADQFIAKPLVTEEFLVKVEALLNGAAAVWPPPSGEIKEEKEEEPKAEEQKKEELPPAPAQTLPASKGRFSGKTFVAAGSPGEGVEKIVQILKGEGATVQNAAKGGDAAALVEQYKADILLLNVLMQDPPAPQVVSSIRRANKKVFIMLYSHQEKDSHDGMAAARIMALADKAKKDCIEAGANNTIGQFAPEFFVKNLSEKLQ